jgi:hypothetical protein
MAGAIRGDDAQKVLRVPSLELEDAVIGALQALLRDDRRLLALMPGIDAGKAHHRIQAAQSLADRLQRESASARLVILKTLLDRVIVQRDRLELSVRLEALWNGEVAMEPELMSLDVPVMLKRCGGAMRLIVRGPDENKKGRADPRLIALLVKAQRWFTALSTGQHASVLSLAEEQRVASADVINVVYLAFIAPDLVQRIVEGDHPQWLGTKRLLAMAPLPLDWREQRRVLGMDAPLTA